MVHVECEQCGKKLSVPERLAGKTVACPDCKHVMLAPAAGFETAIATTEVELLKEIRDSLSERHDDQREKEFQQLMLSKERNSRIGWIMACVVLMICLTLIGGCISLVNNDRARYQQRY